MRLKLLAIATAIACAAATPAFAQSDTKNGEALLTRDCARCHAIGVSGTSPRPDAPPFRTLGTRYPVEQLEEALGEGMMSGHPAMPEFEYDAEDVGDIIDFLKSIQAR